MCTTTKAGAGFPELRKVGKNRAGVSTIFVVGILTLGIGLLPSDSRAQVLRVPAEVSNLATRTKLVTGSFCMQDLPAGSVRPLAESQSTGRGVWWHVKIKLTGGASLTKRPRAFLYSEEPPDKGFPGPCKDDMGSGIRTLLAGYLNSIDIDAWYLPESNGKAASWWFPSEHPGRSSFRAELGGVVAGFDSLYGGNLDARKRLVWIFNRGELLFGEGARSGKLDLEMVDVALKDARVQIDGGYELPPTTLVAESRSGPSHPDGGHVVFGMDVQSGALSLRRGRLYSKAPLALKSGELSIGGATISVRSGSIGALSLTGHGGPDPLTDPPSEVSLDNLKFSSGALFHAKPRLSAAPEGDVIVARISGSSDQGRDAALVSSVVVEGLALSSGSLRLGGTEEAPELAGPGSLKVERLTTESVVGARLTLDSPDLPLLRAGLGEFEGQALHLDANGPKSALMLGGDLAVAKATLGGIAIAAASGLKAILQIDTPAVGDWRAHFDYTGAPASGKWDWRSKEGVVVEGALDKLELHGFVDLAREGWCVTVEPSGLLIEASLLVSREAFLLGAAPVFSAGARVDLGSERGFTVSATGATGACEMGLGAVVLNNAHLVFSDPSNSFIISAPVSLSADTRVRFDLSTGEVGLLQSHVTVAGLTAQSADPAAPTEFAGLKVVAASLSLGSLELDVQAGQGQVRLRGLELSAQHLEHTGDPYLAMDLRSSLELPLVEAEVGRDATGSLRLGAARARGLSVLATNATFRSRDGFEATGRAIEFSAAAVGEDFVQDGRLKITDGDVALNVKDDSGQFGVRTALEVFDTTFSGQRDRLSGAGRLVLQNVELNYHGGFPVNGKCDSPGNRWKIRANAGFGRIELQSQFQDSSLVGNGQVSDASFSVREDGYSQCEFDEEQSIKDEKKIIFDYPCGLRCSGFPPHCDVDWCRAEKTIGYEIPFSIHWVASLSKLDVSGRIGSTNIAIRGKDGISFCSYDYHLNPPLIVASYAPGVRRDPHLPIVSDIVHEALKGVATVFESALAETLGLSASGATFLNQSLGLRSPFCG